jgi:4-hydroxy-2-oxoheptanedioate aldolase
MGVQVPHVNTAADARRAVESVKFHPLGNRGLAAGTRPANYGLGLSAADYVLEANRETLVCVQLEEMEALGNLGEILRVEGVDVFFVGPSDLSQSMGHPGRSDVPEVREAMDRAFAAIVAAGKVPGSAGNPQAIRRHLEQGVRYLYTHIPTLLASGSREFFETARSSR